MSNYLHTFIFLVTCVLLSACGALSKVTDNDICEVREYQEQAFVLDLSPTRREDERLPLSMTNFSAFHHSFDPWLIEGFVRTRDRKFGLLEKRAVNSLSELDVHTTFLVVVASKEFEPKGILSEYFEGDYSLVDVNKVCPIFVGRRHGEFALATIRRRRGLLSHENYRECAVVASLTYFGLPENELSSFESFIKPGLLPTLWEYKTEKIRELLSKNSNC